jgi:alkylation response protein AidB-like acyl-CoA dehydrogenase
VAFDLDDALPLAGDAHTTAIVARAAAHRALAHDLTGAAQQMLDLAVAHACERVQFGRAIGSFQAVQHRLADTYVSVAGARVALEEAWTAPGSTTALLAKLWAGRAARTAARQSLQVLGGLGFTWEHPMHRYLRRVHVLDGLLGSSQQLARELGAEIRAAGDVPTLANL